jgi:CheY-like chemotaxis protein
VTIILAEDHPDFRKVLADLLTQSGHDVHQAADGEEALQLQASVKADVLITDIVMPRKDGIQTIVAFKQNYPNVRIFAISAGGRSHGKDTLIAAKSAGADAVFPKATGLGALLQAIESFR